jgi:hypothetical protein
MDHIDLSAMSMEIAVFQLLTYYNSSPLGAKIARQRALVVWVRVDVKMVYQVRNVQHWAVIIKAMNHHVHHPIAQN